METVEYFLHLFEIFREKIEDYFKPPATPVPWMFHQKLIFQRILVFQERLKNIEVWLKDHAFFTKILNFNFLKLKSLFLIFFYFPQLKKLFAIAEEYLKLEKIEFSGLKGKHLFSTVHDIYEGFTKIYAEFSNAQYDILLPEDTGFPENFSKFLTKVKLKNTI